MNIEKLVSIGMSPKEAILYLTALHEGTSSITHLAKKANLKRPTAYLIIDDLLKRNLLIEVPFGRLTHYQAADPIILAKEIELKRTITAHILPELKSLYKYGLTTKKIKIYKSNKNIIQKKIDIENTQNTKKGIFTASSFFFSFTKKK
jgi:sugar-specific transcriptional regulator TrmB